MEENKENQPKKKGGKSTKKENPADESQETPITETPVESAPLTDTTEPEQPDLTETPAPEAPIAQKESNEESQTVNENKENSTRKPVPTVDELRAMRKYNESVFTFSDGFACVATSQMVANIQHNAWLAGK